MVRDENEKLGALPFVIGGLSFIPLIGVLFGIIAILWGAFSKKIGRKKLMLVGTSGIVFTFVVYGALFYFGLVQRGGIYDELRSKLAQTALNSLVPAVEFYKLEHGTYPASLKELHDSLPKNSLLIVFDPSIIIADGKSNYFYYERAGTDHYYLRSVGPDGQPFTADDMLPEVDVTTGKLGLLLDRPGGEPRN